MIRVMIVDDEILVRVGIKSILDRDCNGYRVVCEAGNCREAIERIKTHHPQIILTDLMMDGMDGFDLIAYCVKEHPRIKLIVLSNYNDFDNVRRAMKMGASDYIFKLTVNSQELYKVLEEVKQELDISASDIDSILQRNISAIKTRLIIEALQQSYIDQDKLAAEFNNLQLVTDFSLPYAVLYISIDGYEGERRKGDHSQLQLLKTSMENIIHDAICTKHRAEVYNYESGDLLVIINVENKILPASIGKHFLKITEYMRTYLGISVSGALSDVYIGLEMLERAVKQASEMLSMRFFSTLGRLYLTSYEPSVTKQILPLPQLDNLTDALVMWDQTAVKRFLNDMFDCLSTMTHVPIDVIRMRILDVYSVFVRQAENIGVSLDVIYDDSGFALYDAIVYYDYIDSIKRSFVEFLPKYEKAVSSTKAQDRLEILQVKQYVRENIESELKVETAAELVHMSKSYFSHLFKKETGMSYVDYINKTRIKKAQELLHNSNRRISEVAEAVGINNPNYFSILFKKITGITPCEFRTKIQNK